MRGREPQDYVAHGRWQAPEAITPIGLRAHPPNARGAPDFELPERFRRGTVFANDLTEDERIFERHRRPARHIGRHRMSGVPDQDDPAVAPLVKDHVLDRGDVHLLERLERGEHPAYRFSEVAESGAQPLQSPLGRIRDESRLGAIRVAIDLAGTHRQ